VSPQQIEALQAVDDEFDDVNSEQMVHDWEQEDFDPFVDDPDDGDYIP
jgi:hypothetical protein